MQERVVTYFFTLSGHFQPYARMTRNGQWVSPAALAYKASQSALAWQYKAQMLEHGWSMLPGRAPLWVAIEIEMPARLHCQDGDNQLKALIDAAQGVVFPNDLWIDAASIRRVRGEEHKAKVEIGMLEDG